MVDRNQQHARPCWPERDTVDATPRGDAYAQRYRAMTVIFFE